MKKLTQKLILMLVLFFIASIVNAQQKEEKATDPKAVSDTASKKKVEKNCEQQALGDWIRTITKKPEKTKPAKDFVALVLPNISSNPTNGFLLGIGGSFGWYMGPKETTKVSSAPFTVAVTSKSQLITFVKHNIYTNNNDYFLQGDWKFYIYSQPTYGLGTNAPEVGNVPSGIHWMGEGTTEGDTVSFPMLFNYVKFHEIVNRRVIGDFYAGVGYHLDYYYSIVDENYRAATDSTPEYNTPHHYHSVTNNFNENEYVLSGVSANFLLDSRDNQIYPYKGYYVNLNYRINTTWLGSSQNSSNLWLEFRTYVPLSKKTPRHSLAFWTFADFNLTGQQPYLTMPNLGEDQRARSGRGYTNGRFRGNDIIYAETEWRFPISQCSKILGGVIFANATTVSDLANDVKLFQYIKPAVGFGVRIMVNKYFRTNINLDYAIGVKSSGFYFSGQETF